ncbi:acetamidase/formamidase family protein [Ancrocorticia populi]|uniref:acetamidase/formamidase family protein n=1 Tax=Ancrocorticia populi TaxID=2175228 RepID=UPI001A9C652D|nr:acetamidase/formamidase family protein [Ancrocorticia populi]
MPASTAPQYSEWITFSVTSVTIDGEQKYFDSNLTFQRAWPAHDRLLAKFDYSQEQARLLLGSAAIDGRLCGVVEILSPCATVYIPTAILDLPIDPPASGSTKIDPGNGSPNAAQMASLDVFVVAMSFDFDGGPRMSDLSNEQVQFTAWRGHMMIHREALRAVQQAERDMRILIRARNTHLEPLIAESFQTRGIESGWESHGGSADET